MPIGILKYKQDDGSIIELNPIGVDTEARASATAAKTAADKANTNIGGWETDHPGQTISECATSIENAVEAADAKADTNAAIIGTWAESHPGVTVAAKDAEQDTAIAGRVKTDYLDAKPYAFSPISITHVQPASNDGTTSGLYVTFNMPWLHTANYSRENLSPKFANPVNFYVMNLTDGSVQTVSSSNVVLSASASTNTPYEATFVLFIPTTLNGNNTYLVYSNFVVIEFE